MQVSIGESDIEIELNTIKTELIGFFISLVVYLYLNSLFILFPLAYFAYKLFFTYKSSIVVNAKTPNSNKLQAQFKGWYRVCLSTDLPVNLIKTFRLLGKDVVVYRNNDGVVSALDAYCSHQGAHLGLGTITSNGNIRCAFHGWCFDKNGQCKTADVSVDDRCKDVPRNINPWIVCEERGIVYLWFGSDKPLFHITPLPCQNNLRHVGTVQFKMFSNIVDIVENHVDFLHFYWIHSNHMKIAGLCFDSRPSKVTLDQDNHKLIINQPAYVQIFGYRIFDFTSTNIINAHFSTLSPPH
jgi:nitrite reductase/ring-hydroxylating ferredoxin subunit